MTGARSGGEADRLPAIVVVGDVMVDTVVTIPAPPRIDADNPASIGRHLGGQAANTASWLRTLTPNVHLVGVLGTDELAGWIRARVLDVDLAHTFAEADRPTGECVIVSAADNSRTMFPSSGANAVIGEAGLADTIARLLQGPAGHLHVSGYAACHDPGFAAGLVRDARVSGSRTSVDTAALTVATALEQWRSAHREVAAEADVLLATVDEIQALRGLEVPQGTSLSHLAQVTRIVEDLVEELANPTDGPWPALVVAKAGAHGAFAVTAQGATHIAAVAGPVIDTTGAGDAFAAGFLATLSCGGTPFEAATRGAEVAATAIATVGGSPTRREGDHGG